MNVTDLQEVWQVDVGGQIYEASFDELGQWITEGALLRQDFVRRGSLRWIEAQKVPGLIKIFNERDGFSDAPGVSTSNYEQTSKSLQTPDTVIPGALPTNAFQTNDKINYNSASNTDLSASAGGFQTDQISGFAKSEHKGFSSQARANPGDFCGIHADTAAEYLCETCGNVFCKSCPNSYGGSVKICPFCGAMCQSIKKKQEQQQKQKAYNSAVQEGFGFVDFSRALGHPFKFMPSLIFGTILFVIFSIGQSVSSFGGMFLTGAALFCLMASNMLSFGVLTNTIGNFAEGKLEADFMPKFDDFSLWEDVVHPFFLSIGVYLVSFGLFIVILIGGLWYTLSAVSSEANSIVVEKAGQSSKTDRLNTVTPQNDEFIRKPTSANSGISTEDEDIEKIHDELQNYRKKELESISGKSSFNNDTDYAGMLKNLIGIAIPFLLLLGVAFIWGIFYLPAACAVAGYTRSFAATINPLVGLDTIKRLGLDYLKILLMGFLIFVFTGIIGIIINFVFTPFDMPMLGNIPSKVVSAIFGFYFTIVFSCILGFALFKNSDKLNLYRER